MTCTDCTAATATQGLWNLYDALRCKWCAARMIQNLPRVARKLDKTAVRTARLNVLVDAVTRGYSEVEIRELAKSTTMAVQPLQTKGKK